MSAVSNEQFEAKLTNDDVIDLSQYWQTIRGYLPRIISLAVVLTILVGLIVMSIIPNYIAKTSLLIESEQANVLSIEEVYGLDASKKEYYQTQYEILKSRRIAEKVARRLNLVESNLFDLDVVLMNKSAFSSFLSGFKSYVKSLLPFLPQQEIMEFTAEEVANNKLKFAVDILMARLTVTPVRSTQIVNISVELEDPLLAANLSNTFAVVYIENYLESKLDMTSKATVWLNDSLQGLRTKLAKAEQKLSEFDEREQVVNIDGVFGLASEQLQQLTEQLSEAQNSLKKSEAVFNELNSGKATLEEVANLPEVLNHPTIINVKSSEVDAQSRLSELSQVYGPKHPKLIAANAELDSIKNSLFAQIRSLKSGINTEYRTAKNKVVLLKQELTEAKVEFRELTSLENQRRTLKREVDINQQLYDSFFTRLKETNELGGFESANARVLDYAQIPTIPSKPKKSLIIILSFIVSIAFGVFLVIILDSLNSGIRSVEDVERKLGQRMLGIIPWQAHKKVKNLPVRHFFDAKNHIFSESIRTLRTSLQLLNIDKPSKTILITSSVPKEGKSTVSINLAFAMGQLSKVLLIDTDLRRPTLAKQFDLPGFQPGVANLLAGTHSIEECLVTNEQCNIDLICAGTIPPNPQELLASDKFKDLIKSLEGQYDHIILDTAPTQAVSDAMVVSNLCDSVVYVVRADSTNQNVINNGLSRFLKNGKRVDGIVLNQVDLKKAKKNGGYSGYYDQYGYNSYNSYNSHISETKTS
jgi:capsular exopolysaccharide synthesis family protein